MGELRYTARARRDLTDIWNHIARDNPHIGVARPRIGPNVRLLVEAPYILIYEARPRITVVIAIVHGARHPERWLE